MFEPRFEMKSKSPDLKKRQILDFAFKVVSSSTYRPQKCRNGCQRKACFWGQARVVNSLSHISDGALLAVDGTTYPGYCLSHLTNLISSPSQGKTKPILLIQFR